VASDADGNFVVVWRAQNASDAAIVGRRFDSSGTPEGAEFQVNTYTTYGVRLPDIASDAEGNFVVVWSGDGPDGSLSGIVGQRYDAGGLPQGGRFQVNTHTTGSQGYPGVASDADGDFTVVWESGHDGSFTGIFGQRYDASGTRHGAEFNVNVFTTGAQVGPIIAAGASGNFVVIWRSNDQDGSGAGGIFGRRFDATGAPQGAEFQVNTYTTDSQVTPTVTVWPQGFVVAWASFGQDGSSYGIFGQRFDAAGARVGSEFQVNIFTANQQRLPSVASSPQGDFVVVWQGLGQFSGSYDIFGQRYGDLIFQDGFESP
jgi:hypothetical protein